MEEKALEFMKDGEWRMHSLSRSKHLKGGRKMKLKVLGSSSSGNCYLLANKKETLILECGIVYKKIQEGLEFDSEKVVGCLVTHEHKDHSKCIDQLIKNSIDVYTSKGTIDALGLKESYRLKAIKAQEKIRVGGFTILPFDTQHDAAEPLGFLIQHEDMGKLLFITDSYYCKYTFKGVDHILVECNYNKEMLEENIQNGIVPECLKDRITRSHFEIENVKEFLRSSDLSNTKNIVLIHLSSQNSNKELFKNEVEKSTGRPVYIAKKGLEIDISKKVF